MSDMLQDERQFVFDKSVKMICTPQMKQPAPCSGEFGFGMPAAGLLQPDVHNVALNCLEITSRPRTALKNEGYRLY